jgi:hypothetical protein
LAQQTVDAQPHHKLSPKRLDMYVAGAQFEGLLEQVIDGAHNGRTASKIAKAVDVVVADGRARAFVAGKRGGVVFAEAFR